MRRYQKVWPVGIVSVFLIACGGSMASSKESARATADSQPVTQRDQDQMKPVPVGAVHPNRVGSRSYVEEYYEPTIIPPKGAAEPDQH